MSRKESMKYTGTEIIYRFNKETGEYEEIGNADTFVKPIGRTEPFMITYLAEIINLIDTLGNKKMQVVKYILKNMRESLWEARQMPICMKKCGSRGSQHFRTLF